MKSARFRHVVEALLTTLLFALQNVVYGGPFISVMFIPLFAYLASLHVFYPYVSRDIGLLLVSNHFLFGRMIAFVGFAIFLVAAVQFLRGRGSRTLVTSGLYSVARHPQYLGIMVLTMGLTIMCLTLNQQLHPLLMWLVQVFGYIAIARYEDWHLKKEYGASYDQYRRDVPFIYPVRCPFRIPETLFTILVSLLVATVLFLVSPNFPRV